MEGGEVQRDFGLLGEDDDDATWSPPPINEKAFNLDHNGGGGGKSSSHDPSKTFKTIASNNKNNNEHAGGFSIGKIKVERPKPVQKMVISPNKPNANSAAKAEIKGIDRPRSHSPLKLTGIEEYVQQYEKTAPSVPQAPKITMNLKMDDLLANVGKNESSYQMLSDFSVLTGDNTDPYAVGSSNRRNTGGGGGRKRSTDMGRDDDDDENASDFKTPNNNDDDDEMNGGDDEEDEGDDGDEDEDEDETGKKKKKKKNNIGLKQVEDKSKLNYKFTAVYRKDETTGAFKEHSKTVFESKLGDSAAPSGFMPVSPRPSRPPAPPPTTTTTTTEQHQHAPTTGDSSSARLELAAALEALRNNSKKLETKLEKIEILSTTTPAATNFVPSSDVSPVEANKSTSLEQQQQQQQQNQTVPTSSDNNEVVNKRTAPVSSIIRKQNDTFFNDILSKSDDLITQTQSKLEKLSKLESVQKPLAIATKSSAPPPPKPKPVASTIVPSSSSQSTSSTKMTLPQESTTPTSSSTSPPPPPTTTTQSSQLGISTTSINNSKSLIDFKASDSTQSSESVPGAAAPQQQTDAVSTTPQPPQQVDLLFDLDAGFTLSSEPIKQGASYFDLIGLSSASTTTTTTDSAPQPAVIQTSLPDDLFSLEQPTASTTELKEATTTSEFRDELLESFIKEEQTTKPATTTIKTTTTTTTTETNNDSSLKKESSSEEINSISYQQQQKSKTPSPTLPPPPPPPRLESSSPTGGIDILITEPLHERDDSNIVPDGYFNLKHEIPKDQSRPHSPAFMSGADSHYHNQQQPVGIVHKKEPSDELSTMQPTIAASSRSRPTTPTSTVAQRLANMPSPTIARPRPVSPSNRPRPPSPTAARSRPCSPRPPSAAPQTILEDDAFISFNDPSDSKTEGDAQTSVAATPTPSSSKPARKERNKVRTRVYDSSGASSQAESSSSESDDEKISVMIRPKANKDDTNGEIKPGFVPLLPRPPKNAQEVEELRQRRRSSDTQSVTHSLKADDESSDDDDDKFAKSKAALSGNSAADTAAAAARGRRDDGHMVDENGDEYFLELPDEDDSAPLADFNDKCELKRYSDDTYGVLVLVRQPFRNAAVLYKNALQKFTEVRTWTEYLVRLVRVSENEKKLCFYNAHELLTMATEQETTIDEIVEKYIIEKKQPQEPEQVPASDEASGEATQPASDEPKNPKAFPPPPPEDDDSTRRIKPFHEITLKATYKFTDMCLQQFDTYTKIHTFKIQELVYKETFQMRPDRIMALPERFFKKFTKPKVTSLLDHTPLPFEICKFAHVSYTYLRSFLLLLQDAFWSLPTITRKLQREQQLQQIQTQAPSTTQTISAAAASIFSLGANKAIQNPTLTSVTSSHTREEITVKVLDEYKCTLDKQCRILSHKSRTRVSLITFLNDPNPTIDIGLNDCLRHGKEIVGRHDIIPIKTEQWISPEAFVLNENVLERDEFERTHALRCLQMPDNLWVELIRFRTRPKRNYELPLHVTCCMHVVGRIVEIRIEANVGGTYFTKLSEAYCQDIQIRFPLPDSWVYMFRVEKRFRYGAVHSSKHKTGKLKGLDRFLVHKSTHQGAMMEASCGMAKYEQAFRSLVWRIEQLPVKNKDVYKNQLFICKLQLQEYDAMPEKYDPIAYVQYHMPICASSKTQVRSISVNPCEEPPEKWVKLKTRFEYELDIAYSIDQTTELPAVDKERCAELQHLTQTESEGDNNETNDDDD